MRIVYFAREEIVFGISPIASPRLLALLVLFFLSSFLLPTTKVPPPRDISSGACRARDLTEFGAESPPDKGWPSQPNLEPSWRREGWVLWQGQQQTWSLKYYIRSGSRIPPGEKKALSHSGRGGGNWRDTSDRDEIYIESEYGVWPKRFVLCTCTSSI